MRRLSERRAADRDRTGDLDPADTPAWLVGHGPLPAAPWCDAPVRHADHADPHRTGGATSCTNGSGLCARCNHTKGAHHWTYQANPDHLDVLTPTGHTHRAPTRALLPTGVGNPRPPTLRAPEMARET